MVPYQLNMARGFVMPLESRKKWLQWLGVYIVVCSVLICGLLFILIRRSSHLQSQMDALQRQEAGFLASRGGQRSITDCRAALGVRMNAAVRGLESVSAFERGKCRAASILLGLTESLPPGIELGSLDFDAEGRKLNFEVLLPATVKIDDSITPPHLVTVWEREPLLIGRLSQMEVANSERVKRDGGDMMCWRFSAVVAGGN